MSHSKRPRAPDGDRMSYSEEPIATAEHNLLKLLCIGIRDAESVAIHSRDAVRPKFQARALALPTSD